MSIELTIGITAILGVLMAMVTAIASAVWVAGKIDTKTEVLANSNNHLSKSLDSFAAVLSAVNTTIIQHNGRIVRLEVLMEQEHKADSQ